MPRRSRAIGEVRLPALAVKQGSRWIYSFAVDGKKLPSFATVSRIHRDDESQIAGYQRPEAIAHIKSIRRYLESDDALLPNAVVIAFDERVRFESPVGLRGKHARSGEIVIPVDETLAEEEKPGWIVDGQQRSAAIREARVIGFPIFVTAFITNDIAEQRSQFILVNSTKPLPKGLIYELLPGTPESHLPIALLKRRFPALLVERLNYDEDSPLKGRIRTPTTVGGTIKDNSMLKMIAASIEDGALYQYFDPEAGGGDIDSMLVLLKSYWGAVADVFPDAWNQSPRRSRLVHGVGIVSMGCLMDEIAYRLAPSGIPDASEFVDELRSIAPACRWTDGVWEFSRSDKRRWNELQNTPREILLLSDHLLDVYRRGGSLESIRDAA